MDFEGYFEKLNNKCRGKALNYSRIVILIQTAYHEKLFLSSGEAAIKTGFSNAIRFAQQSLKVEAKVTSRAKEKMSTIGIDVNAFITESQLKKINEKYKLKFKPPIRLLNWEHIVSVRSISENIMSKEFIQILDPKEMLEYIFDHTFIIAKLNDDEDRINHTTSIQEIKDWDITILL